MKVKITLLKIGIVLIILGVVMSIIGISSLTGHYSEGFFTPLFKQIDDFSFEYCLPTLIAGIFTTIVAIINNMLFK